MTIVNGPGLLRRGRGISGTRAGLLARELQALLAIAQRDLVKLLRDRSRLAVNLAFPVLLVAGLGSVLQPTVGKVTGVSAVALAFTGVLPATLFQSTAAGMISIAEDRETDFSRTLFVAPVTRLTLVAGKICGESLVALFQGGCVVAFAAAIGVRVTGGQLAALALLIAEGQAEPWEAVTTPPDPRGRVMYSCPPEQLIRTYNQCLRAFRRGSTDPWAYLFWGAEYWLLRERHGDSSYLGAFTRILNGAKEDMCQ